MSSLILRSMARRQQLIRTTIRRYATEPTTQQAANAAKSTTENAAGQASAAAAKAQETAANVAAKAQEMFSKGMAAAGPMAAKLGESTMSVVSNAPGGGNKIVSTVQGFYPHVVYYSKVAAELGKHIYRTQQMSPPSLEALQKFYAPYVAPLLNPSGYLGYIKSIRPRIANLPDPQTAFERIQAIPRKDMAQYAVWTAECLGFFTVGQMIGRWKIVGYRGGVKEHH